MAYCLKCNHKIALWKLLIAIYHPYNIRSALVCGNCRTYVKPKHWILYDFFIGILFLAILVSGKFIVDKFELSYSPDLALGLGILFIIPILLLPLIFLLSDYE